MLKKLLKNNEKITENLFIIFASLIFGILGLIFLINNGLSIYDAPGHLSLITYLKTELWPLAWGWNNSSLLGFEQGTTYPSLFHYLAASLSFVVGVEAAVGVIVFSACLVLPVSVYYFVSSLVDGKEKRIFVTSLILSTFLILPGYLGANLKALTQVGLLTSFVSLPLIFFYVSSLRNLEKGKIVLPTLLLSSIILTHLVAGLAVCLFISCFLLVNLLTKSWKNIYLQHLFFTALITSFFWVPFLLNYSSLSVSVHPLSLSWQNLISLLISCSLLVYFWRKKDKVLVSLSLTSVFLGLVAIADNLIARTFSSGFLLEKIYNLHLYRFQIYQYLLVAGLIGVFLVSTLDRIKNKKVAALLSILPIVFALFFLLMRSPFLLQNNVVTVDNLKQGRFLETFSRSQVFPLTYSVQTKLAENKNLPWAYGLFTDATANGPYLSSLIKSLNPDIYPKKDNSLIEDKTVLPEKVPALLNHFGIENLLNLERGEQVALAKINGQEKKFFLENRGPQNLIEIPSVEVTSVNTGWKHQVEEWWASSTDMLNILVNNPDKNLPEKLTGSGQISTLNHNDSWTEFSFDVKTEKEAPVLVKFGYNKHWKAFQNNQEIKIYEASPSLMLVVAKGEVKFKYQRPLLPSGLFLLGLTSIGFLVYLDKKNFFSS